MSRIVFVFVLVAALFVSGFCEHKPVELIRSCGRALAHRIDRVCGLPCMAEFDFSTLACTTGVSDSQLSELCCPTQ
ncbi:hypothetical protein GCK72_001642 [Caenorhabditis remanei]|uniref:INSulin related n=2 Tax=Caenorhabditis remanei TaxID=31234 RepID=E3LLU2_CAERE|nr:hypothetical protein GCK72_001642 [Caenorhabditis remanei]EFP02862.1 hypothetical protein CRE_28321 [Caenorhabditis remanei]KAF1769825.1 hypothetical protein GCK72_001642 [Caenorhabditis remanei]